MTAAKNSFAHTLDWLSQWACSRSFGLGTRLPWDPVYLVESLSDSTIYMAYYTVAHLLQGGDMYCDGEGPSPAGITASDLTNEVWDYVFLEGPEPTECNLSRELLTKMRAEFEYWYPFDLRVSGKDLIQNHLTFCLYTHTAVWATRPDLWPGGMRCNGHLLLNAEKMSKSTGNFKTLRQAMGEYSSDAMRVALADAGDALDDANFEHTTANGAILRLTKELAWSEEVLAAMPTLRDEEPTSFLDRAFNNEISACVHAAKSAYDRFMFREALKASWYDLLIARDTYRFAAGPEGLNGRLVARYLEMATLLLAPICPHTCEHVWGDLLK
jgi:leucyl-tRNA synthetase